MPSLDCRPEFFTLPDLLQNWPFHADSNPCQDIAADSAAWVESFGEFDAKAQYAFNRCKFGVLASFAYPHARGAHFRAACDLLNLSFVFDERVDRDNGVGVHRQAEEMMRALNRPEDPPLSSDGVVGAMTRDFWLRSLASCGMDLEHTRRFIRDTQDYISGVCQRAEDRDSGVIRSITEYMTVRRGTIGFRPSLFYILLSNGLPDDVISHPTIKGLIDIATDMMIIANDVCSYNVEQARGDDLTNLVCVVMREKNLGLQDAMDFIGRMYADLSSAFVTKYAILPEFPGIIERRVKDFCWGVGNWVTASVRWNFASERYFGKEGSHIEKHRCVRLAPKRSNARQLHLDRASM